ncbi:hexon protein [Striga asiatica]|uniref:Hexon protein n=1 Tax=Striga asiatica TaxID=4170 RepID=A0A5A7PFM6_STRAF|nr:hexon protein [Striga asiatica]
MQSQIPIPIPEYSQKEKEPNQEGEAVGLESSNKSTPRQSVLKISEGFEGIQSQKGAERVDMETEYPGESRLAEFEEMQEKQQVHGEGKQCNKAKGWRRVSDRSKVLTQKAQESLSQTHKKLSKRKLVRDGLTTNIWKDPWLLTHSTGRPLLKSGITSHLQTDRC